MLPGLAFSTLVSWVKRIKKVNNWGRMLTIISCKNTRVVQYLFGEGTRRWGWGWGRDGGGGGERGEGSWRAMAYNYLTHKGKMAHINYVHRHNYSLMPQTSYSVTLTDYINLYENDITGTKNHCKNDFVFTHCVISIENKTHLYSNWCLYGH